MVESREAIEAVVHRYPGIHFRAIARELDMAPALVQHHLKHLRRETDLVQVRMDRFTRYFDQDTLAELSGRERRILHHVRRVPSLEVLLVLLFKGPSRHKAITEVLGVTPSGLTYRLDQLGSDRLVEPIRDGSGYRVRHPTVVRDVIDRFPPPPSSQARLAPFPRTVLEEMALASAP